MVRGVRLHVCVCVCARLRLHVSVWKTDCQRLQRVRRTGSSPPCLWLAAGSDSGRSQLVDNRFQQHVYERGLGKDEGGVLNKVLHTASVPCMLQHDTSGCKGVHPHELVSRERVHRMGEHVDVVLRHGQ